jgi:hypothetical protein
MIQPTALLVLLSASPALVAQAPTPSPVAQAPTPSLGERLKVERPAVDKLLAELHFTEALQRSEALLPATKPAFDKTDNQTLMNSRNLYFDLCRAYRMAVETADAAGQWEKALDYAKQAKTLGAENYESIKEPFTKMVEHFKSVAAKDREALAYDDAQIKELKAKKDRHAGEEQFLQIVANVEKSIVDAEKWSKFFQTYLDATKPEATAYDPLVAAMEDKLKREVEQIENYKAGKGDKTKWVDAVISTPAYMEAQGDKAGKMRWLSRLIVIDPDNKKVQKQLDILNGKMVAPEHKKPVKGKKG